MFWIEVAMGFGLELMGQHAGNQLARQMRGTGLAEGGSPVALQALQARRFQAGNLRFKIARTD